MNRLMTAAVVLLTFASAVAADGVNYPDGYRDWRHVKSMTINEGHPLFSAVGGMHHIYANSRALSGYKDARFGNGSVIVFDLFEAVDKDNAVAEGARKAVIVMEKNSARYTGTDGWGYEVFGGNTRVGTLDAAAAVNCHACHIQRRAQDYVFSSPRD